MSFLQSKNTLNKSNDNKHRTPDVTHTLKCVFLGSSGTGKSSIVLRYIMNRFDLYTVPTVGTAFNTKIVNTKALGNIKIEIWDTAGQERFESLVPMYYRDSQIAFIVYDTTDYETFVKAKTWVQRIKTENAVLPMFVLVGNKNDMSDFRRRVPASEAQSYADQNKMMFRECSAKSGSNIDCLFNDACESVSGKIRDNKNSPTDRRIIKSDAGSYPKTKNLIDLEKQTDSGSCFGAFFDSLSKMRPGSGSKPDPKPMQNIL